MGWVNFESFYEMNQPKNRSVWGHFINPNKTSYRLQDEDRMGDKRMTAKDGARTYSEREMLLRFVNRERERRNESFKRRPDE